MDSHACKPDYASVYTSLHEVVVLGCSKHIQMAQNVFPRPNWALKWAVIIRSAIRFDDFFVYSRSSNSTIPRAKPVSWIFFCCPRSYFWNAPHLACSLSLDLLLFGISEWDFRDRESGVGRFYMKTVIWDPAWGRGHCFLTRIKSRTDTPRGSSWLRCKVHGKCLR